VGSGVLKFLKSRTGARAAPSSPGENLGSPWRADGDEYHSSVVWKDGTLVFDIVEIEDGKRRKSTDDEARAEDREGGADADLRARQ
jgi:hypothetical protein